MNEPSDSARLLWPNGDLVSALVYTADPGEDVVWLRYPDGGEMWRKEAPSELGGPDVLAGLMSTATTTPPPLPAHIFLNEYLPAPATGASEYIELYNANAFAVDLSGWRLDDEEGGAGPWGVVDVTIGAPN